MKHEHDDVVGRVRHALALEPRVPATRITIMMIGPDLSLSGILDSPEAVSLAEEVARKAAPGTPIDNGLTVAEVPHGRAHGHLPELAAQALEYALEQLGGRPARASVEVTAHGKAVLHGQCSTAADRELLRDSVRSVRGLREVIVDDLHVAWFTFSDDVMPAGLARGQLREILPEVADNVLIDVRERVAFLRGIVRTAYEHQRIVSLIRSIPGIERVVDHLQLSPSGDQTNDEIRLEQRIKQALGTSDLPVPNIGVFVTRGLATLIGEVDDVDQKRRAGEVVLRVEGVTQVLNELQIASRRGRSGHGPRGDIKHPPRT